MAGALLLVFVFTSFVVVRIGALFLELTGMPWGEAKFQALSLFTTAGFTTAESEAITSHPFRRKIATWLMILGNAGLVGSIGSVAGSFINQNWRGFLLDFGLVAVGIVLMLWILRHPKLSRSARSYFQEKIRNRYVFQHSAEELLRIGDDYILTRAKIGDDSSLANKSLRELALRSAQVLAIDRPGELIAVPGPDDVLCAGDEVVLYGHVNTIQKHFQSLDPATMAERTPQTSYAPRPALNTTTEAVAPETSHPAKALNGNESATETIKDR